MKESTKYTEVEVKHRINPYLSKLLVKRITSMSPQKIKTSSGIDIYYTDNRGMHVRYRFGDDIAELTTKKRFSRKSTSKRIEVDIPLSNTATASDVKNFLTLLGFKQNFSIVKKCNIFYFEHITLSVYEVFKEDGRKLDSFFEIEHRKDIVVTTKKAQERVDQFEAKFKDLGITKKTRLNKSILELFKR